MSDQERPPYFLMALLCLGVTTVYVLAMLAYTDGHFVPQVADLYLIAQYAKGFAEGHPFQYNPGEAPTTGATSLLHTLFLATAHFVGFRGEGLIAFAILSGGAFGFLTALSAYRAARSLSGSAEVARLGVVLVILNGPLAWSFHYGADIALVLFLASWLFAAWIESGGSAAGASYRFVLPACLLVFTRPEASILVGLLVLWRLWDARRENVARNERLRWCLPLVAIALMPVVLRLATGSSSQTSFSQKFLPTNWGVTGAAVFSVEYWTDLLRGILLGFYPSSHRLGLGDGNAPHFAAPFLMVFVFLAFLVKNDVMRRSGAFLLASLVTALAVTPTIHLGFHSNRYLLFALPPLLILFAVGLERAAVLIESGLTTPRAVVFRRLSLLALVFAVLSVSRFAIVYADFASSVYRKDEALFDFIRTRTPETATFLNNGSAIEYRTGRRSVNMSGVVTPGFAAILPVETEASAFELLSRPTFGPLPPFLIAYDAYIASSPAWAALVGGAPLFVTSSLESSELAIYPTRTDLVGRQRDLVRLELPAGLALVDSMNVTDPLDEAEHGYSFKSSVGSRVLFATLKLDKYMGEEQGAGTELADGGRIIMGFEEMEIDTPSVTSDLWLAVRTHPEPSARVRHPEGERRIDLALPQSVVRFTTSKGRTDWFRTPLQPGWNEALYRIPAALLEAPRTRVRIEGRYAAYWYGAYQSR